MPQICKVSKNSRLIWLILFVVCLLGALPNLGAATLEILLPDSNIGRRDHVLKHRLKVRMWREQSASFDCYSRQSVDDYLKKFGARVREQYLAPEQSLLLSPRLLSTPMWEREYLPIIEAEDKVLRSYVIEFDGNTFTPELFANKLKGGCSRVEIAEPYGVAMVTDGSTDRQGANGKFETNKMQASAQFVPNDPEQGKQNGWATIRAYEAWDIYKGDSSVVIGISDSGVLQTHEDLKNQIAINTKEIDGDLIDNDNNGYIDDYNGFNFCHDDDGSARGNTFTTKQGHGTGVAGLACAEVNNGRGIAGIAFRSKMFPYKTTPNGEYLVIYGYEAIMHSAVMGLKVVNCSWAGFTHSCIDESIIEYANAKDVAIVAAAGNQSYHFSAYPGAYKNVLAVGASNPDDAVWSSSNIGLNCRLLAPGNETRTTSFQSDNAYMDFCCTSGSSPIAAGVVALIRGRHPELSAIQSIEFCRQMGDDIRSKNPDVANYIPKRLNALRAVSEVPMSTPSLRLTAFSYSLHGNPMNRFYVGDTIVATVSVKNHLGLATNVRTTISVLDDAGQSVELVRSTSSVASIPSGADMSLGNFELVVKQPNPSQILLRFDLTADGGYHDHFFLPFTPTASYKTFTSDSLNFALADNGFIGWSDPTTKQQGIGFRYSTACNLLFDGGVLATSSAGGDPVTVGSVRLGGASFTNDFTAIKPFLEPNSNTSIIRDDLAGDRKIGLQVTQTVLPPSDGGTVARVVISVKNISGSTLPATSFGYFFDWDLGSLGANNRVRAFAEAIPPAFASDVRYGAELQYAVGQPFVGAAVRCIQSSGVAQYAGLNSALTYDGDGFSITEKVASLTSGGSNQWTGIGDAAMVVGANFTGAWADQEEREMVLCVGANWNRDLLSAQCQECLGKGVNAVAGESPARFEVQVYPQPAQDKLVVELPQSISPTYIRLFSALGQLAYSASVIDKTFNIIHLNDLPTGAYSLQVEQGRNRYSKTIQIVR